MQELNDAQMMAMVEPIPYTKDAKGEAVWDNDPLALVKAVGISAALGGSSAYTWLKIQATADIATVAQVTTQPLLLLGGAPGPDPEATFALWEAALASADGAWPGDRPVAALPGRPATLLRRWRVLQTWCSRPQRTGNEPSLHHPPARWPTATSRFR